MQRGGNGLEVLAGAGRCWWLVQCFGKLYILGDINQYRARTTTTSDLKCFVYNVRQVFNSLHQKIVLGDWLRNAKHISLLKCITTDKGPRYLAGDCHNWCRV